MAGFSIDGLMSNLDTTKIVNAIIESESGMVNHLRTQQAETTQSVATYKSISALMLALKTTAAPLAARATYDVFSLFVSDEDVLDAEATAEATPGTFTMTVEALARNHQLATQGYEDADTTSLGTGTIEIALGNGSTTTLTIDATNDTLTGVKNAINEANLGIRAAIVDDGTAENPYRLVLTAEKTGKANRIHFTGNLSGGTPPNLATAVFDDVETEEMSAASTATITKGPTAAYAGDQNKTFTFTVGGTGVQTVGSGDITITWTDGADSGTIVVSEADTEVALTGAGADGLKLMFGAGTLQAGDQFSVQGFAPTLQAAADARVSVGSTAGGGSPIVISSATNTIDTLLGGVTLTLKTVSAAPVTITVARDKQAIKDRITALLDKYNEVMRNIDKQFSYNPDTKEAGVLLGDGYLLSLQGYLRSAVSGALSSLPASMNMLAALGIRTGESGMLMLTDTDALFDAIDDDLNSVKNLFTHSGTSTNLLVQFLSATAATRVTSQGYAVAITQAATQGYIQGSEIYDPAAQAITIDSANQSLGISLDGVTSQTITLAHGDYTSTEDLVRELQSKIDADANVGKYHLTVEWVATSGTTGYLRLVSPSFGETSQVNLDLGTPNSAYQALGLANRQEVAGKNVQGTINGEPAIGLGRLLTGEEGNATTAGLQLLVNLTESDLTADPEAVVTYAEGFAARLDRVLASLTDSVGGMITRRTKGLENQITYYAEIIKDHESRLAERRQKLFARFYELEKTLSDLQGQSTYLNSQVQQAQALFG